MNISEADLEALTRDVWSTMIGMDLVDAVMAGTPGAGISSQIEIQGDTDVALRIDCSMELARKVAARLFDMPEDEIETELVLDAMSEMANIIGGNLKGLWPGAIKLSLPVSWESAQSDPNEHFWNVARGFDSADGSMLVRVSGDGGN
ncbi:MAG: chemotaxis protein CheX [Immundisolibacter sp.]|uniref:chemotaxis protein CheX n=1 Tax=Immundisolibacter sp. TaxID=1934948 RepID=UPI003D1195C4